MQSNSARIALWLVVTLALAGTGCHSGTGASGDDTLVVAMPTFSESTFLPWNGSTGRKLYLDAVYQYLIYIDPATGALESGLAERWDMSADGRVHTFHLRRGVQFQGGWGELTADDVRYTLERMIDPRSIAGPASPLRTMIERVEVRGRYEAAVYLNAPDIEFASAYMSNGLVVPIVSERYLQAVGDEAANRNPVGTGPYVLTYHKKDVELLLEMREDRQTLWRGIPDFHRVRFLAAPEEFTRVAMLKTGEVDLAPVNFDSIRVVERSGLQVIYVDRTWAPVIRLGGISRLFPNAGVPWADRRVRQAMNYAIDKQAILQQIFHGRGVAVGADFPSPDFMGIAPYPYDPQGARDLLREAGFADGFDIRIRTFTTMPGAELPIIAEIVALYWEAVGIRVTIEPTSWVALRGLWSTGHATDLAWTHRGFPFPSTLAGLQSSILGTSVFAGYSDAVSDVHLDRLGASLDFKERQRIASELGQYLRDEAIYVYIGFVDEPFGASAKVGHWPALSQQSTNIDLITRAAPARLQ